MSHGTKLTVAILSGGVSGEHEISLHSAHNVAKGLDRNRYDLLPIGIDKTGRWRLYDEDRWIENPADAARARLCSGGTEVALVPGRREIFLFDQGWGPRVDVIFPVLHGPGGEDGTIQGLLELCRIPYVGAGVLGSAAGMNKILAKRVWEASGIPIGPYVEMLRIDRGAEALSWEAITRRLIPPVFVKPASLGSSVGISKAKTRDEFDRALEVAFGFDREVIVEESIDGREIECAVLGNERPQAAWPGEIVLVPRHEFYSYEAKYLDPDGADINVRADLPDAVARTVMDLACRAFVALKCRGMARVDFFLRRSDGALFLNEINTIPGFTAISMYPQMWDKAGLPLPRLLDRLIELAMETQPTP